MYTILESFTVGDAHLVVLYVHVLYACLSRLWDSYIRMDLNILTHRHASGTARPKFPKLRYLITDRNECT